MATTAPAFRKTVFAAYMVAVLSCVTGLGCCLIKSPQARSETYIAAAVELAGGQQIQTAVTAAAEAVRLNPVNRKGWTLLAALLQQNGDQRAAVRASRMAAKLGGEGAAQAPSYALPAALKLSLLAEHGPAVP